jgi:hypothetical protein
VCFEFATNFFSCNIFSPRYDGKSVFQSNANQARILMFHTHNYNVRNPCFHAICVCSIRSVAPNSIKVTQCNQMAFCFFLGLLGCCRKQLKPRFPRSKQCCWVSWTAGMLPETARTKTSCARNNAGVCWIAAGNNKNQQFPRFKSSTSQSSKQKQIIIFQAFPTGSWVSLDC